MGDLLNIFPSYDKNRPLRVIWGAGKRPEITVYILPTALTGISLNFS